MRWTVCCGLAILLSCAGVTRATTPENTLALMQFDLPAQPLGDSLRAIGIQTSINVLFDPTMVQGQLAPAFKARATFQLALLSVLQGSGLKLYFIDERTVTLLRKSTVVSSTQKIDRPQP